MDYFQLPPTTNVQRIISKNNFDSYTNTKQKKLFTDKITRITWNQKLSTETVNLESNEIKEIQIFTIELKLKEEISPVLDIIDKAIPYHIIFIVRYHDHLYLSTSKKHPNPTNENSSVIDWTFKSSWFKGIKSKYQLNLKQSIDAVFKDFCIQLSGRFDLANQPLDSIIETQKQINSLKKEIAVLKSSISKSKQFNRKVELNLILQKKEVALLQFVNNDL